MSSKTPRKLKPRNVPYPLALEGSTLAVLTDEETAIFGNGDANRAAPDFAFGRDETGHEIFVFAARFAGRVIERHTHNFVAGALHPVP
jgi:hypothetical protein